MSWYQGTQGGLAEPWGRSWIPGLVNIQKATFFKWHSRNSGFTYEKCLVIFHSFLYVDQRVNGRLSMANVRLNGQYPSDLRLKLEVPTIKENHVEVHFFCQKTIQKHLRVFSKFLFDTFFFLGSMGISGS